MLTQRLQCIINNFVLFTLPFYGFRKLLLNFSNKNAKKIMPISFLAQICTQRCTGGFCVINNMTNEMLCECSTGFRFQRDSANICERIPQCTADTNCPEFEVCEFNQCVCTPGYLLNQNGVCEGQCLTILLTFKLLAVFYDMFYHLTIYIFCFKLK